ncbi:DUF2189 domain-containing protein [Rhizobium sp. LjRoot254]|uniref:DUF2189 domain-containing protein n=1 Tax=Rhizobium sp. LjRoot254 TaxID=3342297 RepID=UPI003ED14F8A
MTALHIVSDAEGEVPRPNIRKIGMLEVFDALHRGWIDFREKPSHYVFLCLLYPVAGLVLMAWSAGANLLPLMFPLASGFALVGPIAALGLYEISRKRELGLDPSWREALEVRKSPALFSIAAVAAVMFAIFVGWLVIAQLIYEAYFGVDYNLTTSEFFQNVLGTSSGWAMMFWGDLIGLVFAIVVLAISVVTFPLLLERDVGAVSAIWTSIRATAANPLPVFLWGLIVAVLLFIGSIPIFAGLAVVLPVLGHATWHLYRKLVEPPALDNRVNP